MESIIIRLCSRLIEENLFRRFKKLLVLEQGETFQKFNIFTIFSFLKLIHIYFKLSATYDVAFITYQKKVLSKSLGCFSGYLDVL